MAKVQKSNIFHKIHGYLGVILGLFILWMVVWGVVLSNRELIRNLTNQFGNMPHPETTLSFPDDSIFLSEAIEIGNKTLGEKLKIKRIELKWESGAPIYRIRYKNKAKSEITIHAKSGKILLYPSKDKELKKIAQDMHVMEFLTDKNRWVFDILAVLTIIMVLSGVVIMFGKFYYGKAKRKIHVVAVSILLIPFFIMAVTGFMLNHEDYLEDQSIIKLSSSPTEKPSVDFDYGSLNISADKAVEIFQKQFTDPRELRRAVLVYSKQAKTMVWNVEPNDGMRIVSIIDAYTGEIIKPSDEILLVEFIDQLHELFLFGRNTKYIVDVVGILLIISIFTGFLLLPQTIRR